MTLDHELRELIREAAKLAIRDEVPALLREHLKQFTETEQRTLEPGARALDGRGCALRRGEPGYRARLGR